MFLTIRVHLKWESNLVQMNGPIFVSSPDDPKIKTGYNSEYEKYRKDDTLCYSRQKLQSLTFSYHR